ncbi:hypothetical protein HIM_01036 [Hirsutella minnesotensis 3608]|nr:hypothetical protein HIM_01036 [Hirsutella minnesotensis 3608]
MEQTRDSGWQSLRPEDPRDLHALRHHTSNVSALSDADYVPYNPASSTPVPLPQPLRGRESLVSIDSRHGDAAPTSRDEHEDDDGPLAAPAASVHWPGRLSYAGARYAPVTSPAAEYRSFTARALSMGRRRPSYASAFAQKAAPESIPEDEYDLSLLRSAAPMGASPSRTEPRYDAIPEDESPAAAEAVAGKTITPAFDVTSALGPMGANDAAFTRKLQEHEAQGTLTGGLGQGFEHDSRVRVRDTDLLRHNMEGSSVLFGPESRASTSLSGAAAKPALTQVFYPQPNWKPFAMRPAYLTLLITVSIALAGAQEALFRRFGSGPIVKFQSPEDVDTAVYLAVKFAPSLCAVGYGVLWQFTDFEVRRLEAYYQLSRPGGARAAESINVDYVTSYNFLRPLRALRRRHYAVALSSVASILAVSLVPTFAAAMIVLTPSRKERIENPTGDKMLLFSSAWSRLLTSTLALCAVAGCALFYTLQTRRSGLLADVRGIAGLASMAVVSHILMDFKDMDTVKHRDIHHKLKYNRYILRNSSLAPEDEKDAYVPERSGPEDSDLSQNPHPVMLRAAGCMPFFFGLLAYTAFVPAFLFTGASALADKAPWVVTAMAVGLKLSWTSMETAVRVMEPFYILSRRHAPAKTLMLDYTALPFGYLPLRALFNGHALVFMVGLGSVLAELLTILVTGLATVDGQAFLGDKKNHDARKSRLGNSGQETFKSFYVSFGVSMFILVYMAVTASAVFLRRRHPFLPRQPNTISSVLAYIHQSKMLYDFVGTAKLGKAEMARRLEAAGKTYGLGWFEGRDGQTHCGVDQEELTSNYKHGVDYAQRNQPWNVRWDVF